jgi:hypothetical protein
MHAYQTTYILYHLSNSQGNERMNFVAKKTGWEDAVMFLVIFFL